MSTIGNLSIISSHTLLIPSDQSATINVEGPGFRTKIKITFDNSGGESQVHFDGDINLINFRFANWNNPLGASISQPGSLIQTPDGGKLLFLAWNQTNSGLNKLDIQFMYQKGFSR